MAYIGTKPTVGNFQICDAISVVNGQAAYTMQVGSVNVIPQSANHMIVSLNGTIQKPNSSFTVSGSTITFASNLATGDVIDFIQILGDVLDLGVPSDATVTTAKLATDAVTEAKIADGAVESEHLNANIISGQTELAEAPADTDELLVSDAGVLKRMDYSHIKASSDWVKLASATVSSVSEVNIEGYFSSTYENYVLVLNHWEAATKSTTRIRFKFGSSYSTSNYYFVQNRVEGLTTDAVSDSNRCAFAAGQIEIAEEIHTNQDWGMCAVINIFQPYKTDRHKFVLFNSIGANEDANTPMYLSVGGGLQYTDLSAVTGIKINQNTGYIESGDWILYGVKK